MTRRGALVFISKSEHIIAIIKSEDSKAYNWLVFYPKHNDWNKLRN
ncbi:MAG: hypothetical protein ACFFER_12850 [Candidatus Thorarchaeota archaeon]